MKAITSIRAFVFCLALAVSLAAGEGGIGEEILANSDVIGLARSGMASALIVAKIQSAPNAFDLSARALIALKENGVSDEVVKAMMLAAERSSDRARLDQPRFRLELENVASGGEEARAAGLAWMLSNREQAVPILRRSIADGRPEIRSAAILALSRLGDRESLPVLRNLLADPAPPVRNVASRALFEMNDGFSISAAERAVARQLAPLDGYARLLGHARLTRAAGSLGQALIANPDMEGRVAAAWALGEIGRTGVAGRPALEKALAEDADPRVRRSAAEAIAKLRDARSAESLKDACRRDPEVRKIALDAMADYPEAIEFLVGVMNLGADQIAADELELARISLNRLTGEDFGLDGRLWGAWFADSGRVGASLAKAPAGGGASSGRREVDMSSWGLVADPSAIPMAPQADDLRSASLAAFDSPGIKLPMPSDFAGGSGIGAPSSLDYSNQAGPGLRPPGGLAETPAISEIPEFSPDASGDGTDRGASGYRTWSSASGLSGGSVAAPSPPRSGQPSSVAASSAPPARAGGLRPVAPIVVASPAPDSQAGDDDDGDMLGGFSLPLPPPRDEGETVYYDAGDAAVDKLPVAPPAAGGFIPVESADPFVGPDAAGQSSLPGSDFFDDSSPEKLDARLGGLEAGEEEIFDPYAESGTGAVFDPEAGPDITPGPPESANSSDSGDDSGSGLAWPAPPGSEPPDDMSEGPDFPSDQSGGGVLFVEPEPGQIVIGEPLAAPAEPATEPFIIGDDAGEDEFDGYGQEEFPLPPFADGSPVAGPAQAETGGVRWPSEAMGAVQPPTEAPEPEIFDPGRGSSLPPVKLEGSVESRGGRGGMPPLLGEGVVK